MYIIWNTKPQPIFIMTTSFYPSSTAQDSTSRIGLLQLIIEHCDGISLGSICELCHWFDNFSEGRANKLVKDVNSLPNSPYSVTGDIPAKQALARKIYREFKLDEHYKGMEMINILDDLDY